MKGNKEKQLQAILICIALLGLSSLQQSTKFIRSLTLTKIPKGQPSLLSLNRSDSISQQLKKKAFSYSQTEYKGAYTTQMKRKQKKLIIDILHQPIEDKSLEKTHILTIEIPFLLTKDYNNTFLSYSTSATPKLIRLNPSSIQNYSIDQELYLFKGKRIKTNLSLIFVQTKILLQSGSSVKVTESDFLIEHLEVNYETADSIFSVHFGKNDSNDLGKLSVS